MRGRTAAYLHNRRFARRIFTKALGWTPTPFRVHTSIGAIAKYMRRATYPLVHSAFLPICKIVLFGYGIHHSQIAQKGIESEGAAMFAAVAQTNMDTITTVQCELQHARLLTYNLHPY
jgi:hypothetical protein